MTMKSVLLLFFTVLQVVLVTSGFSQSVYIRHYTTNDGLAGNHVYMCHQDNDGYLWIATTSGLSRFDGKKFRNYGHEDGLPDNEVLFVTNDADNNIWVRTFSSIPAISIINNTPAANSRSISIRPVPIEKYMVSDELYSARGKVTYLNGDRAIICIKDNHLWKASAPLTGGSPIFETEDGTFFSGDGMGLYTIHDTVVRFFQSLDIHEKYTRLCYYRGMLYVVVGNKVLMYEYKHHKFSFFSSVKVRENINLIHADQYGIWITFIDRKGIFLYRDNKMKTVPAKIRVNGIVNHVTTDSEGGVWISSTDNGIFYIPFPDVINYTVNDGLASSVIYAVDPVSSHIFWTGNNTGNAEEVEICDSGARIKYRLNLSNHRFSNDFIVGIGHDSKGRTYILSRSRLLVAGSGHVLPSLGANKSLLIISDSVIGIGGWNYMLLNQQTLKMDTYNIGRVYAQALDDTGGLWLGSINGLYYMSLMPVNKPIRVKGMENTRINALAVSGRYIWAGTQNDGIYLVKDNRIAAKFTVNNTPGMPSNTVKSLALLDTSVWIGTNRGILHGGFSYPTLKFSSVKFLDQNDGFLSSEVNDIKIADSSVFVATYEGVTVITGQHHNNKLNYRVSDIFIRSQDSSSMIWGDSAELQYSTGGLEIGVQTAALRYGNDIVYRYMLKPFDKTWKTTRSSLIQYTNIPPGNYTFMVTAFDNRGNASVQPVYRYIHISPLYWQTAWFRLLLIAGMLALITLLLLWYFRAAKKRMNEQIMQGRLIARARLVALRAQLKPHFIFNSLNAIKDYIYSHKNDDAADLLQGFAGLVRKGLYLSGKDFVTIDEEVGFLRLYLELEQTKCEKCFDYIIEVPEKITTIVIPSLITQPFAENAVIHGIRSVRNERPLLHITYSLNDNDIICRIADNGIGIKRSLEHKRTDTSIGTLISRERINYFKAGLGIDIDLDITDLSETDSTKHGTIITIIIRNALKLSKNENGDQNTHNR